MPRRRIAAGSATLPMPTRESMQSPIPDLAMAHGVVQGSTAELQPSSDSGEPGDMPSHVPGQVAVGPWQDNDLGRVSRGGELTLVCPPPLRSLISRDALCPP